MSLKSNAKHKDHFDKNDENRAEPDIHVTLVTNDNIQIYMQKSAVGLERNTHSHKSTHQERQRCWMNEKKIAWRFVFAIPVSGFDRLNGK